MTNTSRFRFTGLLICALLTACSGGSGASGSNGGSDGGSDSAINGGDGGGSGGTTGTSAGNNNGTSDGGSTGTATGGTNGTAGDAGSDGGDAGQPPTLQSIDLTPTHPSAAAGTTVQFTATGTYSDSSTADITSDVTWTSSKTSVATVGSGATDPGLAHAASAGDTTIGASLDGISGSTTLTVTSAVLQSITVDPTAPSVANGTEVQFTATGHYSDSTTQDLTTQVTWKSSDGSVATISNAAGSNGAAATLSIGSTTITATLNGTHGTTTLAVTAATLASISLEPTAPTLANGTQVSLTAIGTYTDGSKQDLTSQVTWSSSDKTIADVSNGVVTGVSPGSATIKASFSGMKGRTTVTVTNATLSSIAVDPASATLAKGTQQQLSAFGTFSDGSVQDLTTQVTWSSSDTGVATVSNAASSQGLATAVAQGSADISATFGGKTGSSMLTVTKASLQTVEVTPATSTIAVSTTQQFAAIATFSDGSKQDVTAQAAWSSARTNVATVDANGLATGVSAGSAGITATFNGKQGTGTLTVTGATLKSIVIAPVAPSVAAGTKVQFTATGTYSDGSQQDLTSSVTWASSDSTLATIANGSLNAGLATTIAPGSATISASLIGVAGNTTLTITDATLDSITVAPDGQTIAAGSTLQFTATGNFSDGSHQDLTDSVAWSSSDNGVASISNTPGSKGLATGQGSGDVTIGAKFNGVAGTAGLHVTVATVTSITVAPANPKIATGTNIQLSATAHYSDGSSQDVTSQVTWSSSDSGKVSVTNSAFSAGLAFGLAAGTATITAKLSGMSGTTHVTVADMTLQSIAVSPSDATIDAGKTQQFTATGTFTDGSNNYQQDITTIVDWSISPAGIAAISNLTGSKGLATGFADGDATVTATLGAVSGTASLSVNGNLGPPVR